MMRKSAALARRVAPMGTVDVGRRLGLPPLPARDVALLSATKRQAIKLLGGSFRALAGRQKTVVLSEAKDLTQRPKDSVARVRSFAALRLTRGLGLTATCLPEGSEGPFAQISITPSPPA